EQVTATQEASQPMTQTATVDDIMRQIGDYVRMNATPDVKEMEIQLTPANLGQVHINIASRNGVVTAQITTENEIVKQAMETQVVQLRERLEGQGVRIEAVEVTVASHEFERNLDENGENRDTGGEEKKPSTKRWNLSEMGDDLIEGETLTDAEQVELDMMKLRGGNLNYMV
ncbi:MAG: flagellar hook-length control protein FliK, partial [Lachnospiraceae bacterium]|nr:flagellar hook-length control protein FliK [Lachnospiraceae bacterium]